MHSVKSRMHVKCKSAKVTPCKGSMAMSAGGQAVSAITVQRIVPAAAASMAAGAGPRRSSKGWPMNRNIITSAATDKDHSRPAVPGPIPAEPHMITAKLSCSAWLPRINAAIKMTRRYA